MIHTREEVIERVNREFRLLDDLVANLTGEQWQRPLGRPDDKDPWTVKDALAHITYWKANFTRSVRGQPRPPEERGLPLNALNHLVYSRWHDRPPSEVLDWHRQAQAELLAALRAAPETYFSGKARGEPWPADADAHSAEHRVKDIQRALARQDA